MLTAMPGFAAKKGSTIRLRPATFTFSDAHRAAEGFSVKASLDLKTFDGDTVLFNIPNLLNIRMRHHNPKDIRRQNYPAGTMADGSVPVLEAGLTLRLPDTCTPVKEGQPKVQEMTVGVPLALLKTPWGRHELLLNYTGVAWEMYVDGRLVDKDFALGEPDAHLLQGILPKGLTVSASYIPQPNTDAAAEYAPVQYFTPRGHNAWVGDVATLWHDGRYHVFYLLDRRGHESKFGRGGHYFEHLSTTDFRNWTEHEAATPIEEQWETFGTGTPFVWHDSLYLSYGMHTSRVYPSQLTSTPRQWDYIRQHGESQTISFDHPFTADTDFPSGASYVVSQDGVAQFRKSHLLIHPAENPTIYTDAEGRLCMLANYGARGMWTSDHLDGGWRCLSEDFPPGGDCTFIFPWGDYEYIVGGFTHMWMKRADEPVTAYRDMVAAGLDFYDGLSVPSISEVADGRRLMAGWVEINRHWGGPLVIRELIQHPDGRIGTRFMPELMPVTKGKARSGKKATQLQPGKNYLITLHATPTADGTLTLTFAGDDDTPPVRWTLDTRHRTARFGEGKTLRQGGQPQHATDYAIDNLTGTDQPFTLRIIVRGEAKLGGTLVDVEIAGQRTMITHRSQLRATHLDVQAQGISVSRLTTVEVE